MGHIYSLFVTVQEPEGGQLELVVTDPNLTGGNVFKHCMITYGNTAHNVTLLRRGLGIKMFGLSTVMIETPPTFEFWVSRCSLLSKKSLWNCYFFLDILPTPLHKIV